MEKLGLKIPMLVFFLGIIYYASKGFSVMDAIVRSFLLSIGVALVMLIFPMALMFILTLQRSSADAPKGQVGNDHGKKVEMQV